MEVSEVKETTYFRLLEGERLMFRDKPIVEQGSLPCSIVLDEIVQIPARIVMTNFRVNCTQLVVRPDDISFCHLNSIKLHFFDIPLLQINRLERAYIKDTHIFYLFTKDGRELKIGFTSRVHGELNVFYLIYNFTYPRKLSDYFAFSHSFTSDFNGWLLFDIAQDFRRLGVTEAEESVRATQTWQFIDNEQGQLCMSYPPLVVVPKLISHEEITSIASFRANCRVPVLVWLDPSKHCSLMRASSPKVSQSGSDLRCPEDDKLLEVVANNCRSSTLTIIDERHPSRGGEPLGTQTEVRYLNTPDIQTTRTSFNTMLIQANSVPTIRYLSTVESSGWLEHISALLTGVNVAVDKLQSGESVLLQCVDGWDRSAQLSSLIQLCLDSSYRTLQGFCSLIEKDWCQFGHQFAKRCGHAAASPEDQQSPIFVQFLDCVNQLLRQFPTHFEFNERLLLELTQLLYNCRFGTFLCDSHQDRIRKGVVKRTTSVWSYVLSQSMGFVNPFYKPSNVEVISPNVSLRRLLIWKEFFSCWNRELYFSFLELNSQRDLEEELMNFALEGVSLYKSKLVEKDEEIKRLKDQLEIE
jgi:hypothetical protein